MPNPTIPEEKPRGAGGQFISEEKAQNLTPTDLPDLINQSTQVTGGIKEIAKAKEEAEIEKPLVTVSVHNPIAWLMKVINNLKKKQTTTVTFRLGVPLIALPVIIAAIAGIFFGLGKYVNKEVPSPSPTASVIPTPYLISKVGILKLKSDQTYILILPQGNILTLTLPENSDLANMNNQRVLVTGMLDPTNRTLTISGPADIELLRPIIPSPSPLPSEAPALPAGGPAKEGV